MTPTPKIQISGVSKVFQTATGQAVEALHDINIDVKDNEFICVIGRSGCGKSTLLNLVSGFLSPTNGEISVDGNPIRGPGQGKGVVFQSHALFPWLTARKNIEFGCKQQGKSAEERARISSELIELVHLTGFEDKFPFELSGGMCQRVAIARALAIDPTILLMDEPFGALDEQTRLNLQNELLNIWSERKKTVIFITHSISESIVLADRIILLGANPGHVKAEFTIDIPRPRDRFSDDFVKLETEIQKALN